MYGNTTTQFTTSQSQSISSLSASVSSLRSSLSLLDSSISILDAGISDFPRLKKVLSSTRHFELTPSTTLTTAQASLAAELAPAITTTTLLGRCESHIGKLERREGALIARSELLEGRLSNDETRGLKKKRSLDRLVKGKGRGGDEKAARLKALRLKKERLGYAVERLGLQSQQRQRQLRMSVAAGATLGDLGGEEE
ncbi:putative DASH complex subunit SPC19 [Glarea lozoyensis 74030]|uniref:DASH complex subunit SPC19 n=1 Tax=Glarea lozoyensis (strain ATCC 74030 / MF5533) TaxID=1104152 RepID=H0EV81_GLAL7|nr:putative DASH complex subunit SPC19 [Glarea lozoyensis 74030]